MGDEERGGSGDSCKVEGGVGTDDDCRVKRHIELALSVFHVCGIVDCEREGACLVVSEGELVGGILALQGDVLGQVHFVDVEQGWAYLEAESALVECLVPFYVVEGDKEGYSCIGAGGRRGKGASVAYFCVTDC